MKNLNYTIKQTEIKDANAIIDYLYTIAGESNTITFSQSEMTLTVEKEIEFIKTTINSKNNLMLIAKQNNEIISLLTVFSSSKPRLSHVGEIGISVLKKYWNKGIASNMFNEMFKWVENSNLSKLSLRVREDNIYAIKLYKKYGFEQEGLLKNDFLLNNKYYNNIIMEKILNKKGE
ncbi:MAG: acetyltransferase, family [Fusobacteriales bacterium]|jgi:RimJ/RimL family protein N-acetyltransferase|nr:acetyltransferase, family [Fusobacteriales bacterium]